MIWPFKRRTLRPTRAERAAALPMPECGKPVEHLWWLDQSMPCPRCARLATLRAEAERENRLAEKIAEAIAVRLHKKGTP